MLVATGFRAGYLPIAPGTWGTAAAVPLYLALSRLSASAYLAACLFVVAVSVVAADRAERDAGVKDPGFVVIDEVAGFLVTMFGMNPGWRTVLAGFLLFRVFDVLKPPPARASQHLRGGLGIVADDIIAGLYANLALRGLGAWLGP